MKRIAAVAALLVAMLAVPAAAAMASTVGTGQTGQSQSVCPPPYLYPPHVRHFNRYRHHHPRRSVICSVTVPYQPQSQNCPSGYVYGQTQAFTFDVASGSSTVVELSGPTLAAGEEFTWDGTTYTIWSVNPGANSFTMSAGSSLYVNGEAATISGGGQLLCSN